MSSGALQIRLATVSNRVVGSKRDFLVVILVAIAVMLPAMVLGIPSNRDLSNHFRFTLPFYDALRSGVLYPGWLAESNGGYGDASFRFYPPALYYLLALMRAITGGWYVATLVTFTLISVVGSVGLYLWGSTILPSKNAMWASILFALAPYHLNQYYQATMLAEFAGTALLPFAFYFVERICRGGSRRDAAGLAISYAALLLTHLPLAVIGSIALFVYALVRLTRHQWVKTSFYLGLGILLGLVASSRYWTNVLAEQTWIRADNILPDPSVDYRVNFVLSTFSPDNLNVWWMNILLLATVAMLWPAITLAWSHKTKPEVQQPTLSGLKAPAVLLLLTLLMMTPVTRSVWSLLKTLQQTQFPWRWLAITSMVAPLLIAAAIPYWETLAKNKKRPLAILALGSVAISIMFSASHTVREAKNLNAREFERTLQEIPGSPGVSQWWPSWVNEPVQKMNSHVEAGDRSVEVQSWEPELRKFTIGAGKPQDVRVRTFFYPHWKAFADGKELGVRPDTDGALLLSAPAEASSVTLEFREPGRVRVAALASMLGCLMIAALLFLAKPLKSAFV